MVVGAGKTLGAVSKRHVYYTYVRTYSRHARLGADPNWSDVPSVQTEVQCVHTW